jgi:hypothetical protein
MPETEHSQLWGEIRTLRKEVTDRLDSLSKALGSLIRMEERISGQNQALGRIGREVDDHEKRIRALEYFHSGDRVRWGVSSWAAALAGTIGGGVVIGVVVAVVLYLLGVPG